MTSVRGDVIGYSVIVPVACGGVAVVLRLKTREPVTLRASGRMEGTVRRPILRGPSPGAGRFRAIESALVAQAFLLVSPLRCTRDQGLRTKDQPHGV
jgi:hypothetical protein